MNNKNNKCYILKNILNDLRVLFAGYEFETAAVLLGKEKVISYKIFDIGIVHSSNLYVPNVNYLNSKLKESEGYNFLGFIHCHMVRENLSTADISFANKIIEINNLKNIHMLLYIKKTNNFKCYLIDEKNNVKDVEIVVVDNA